MAQLMRSFSSILVGALMVNLPILSWAQESLDFPSQEIHLPKPKGGRVLPLVTIVGDNAGTETTDFIIPYGVLKESAAAEVITVSTKSGEIEMMPALKLKTDMGLQEFDFSFPDGADIVIVPALHNNQEKKVIDWVRSQYLKGAFVISICEGSWILARAGLLEGKFATTHWYAQTSSQREFPNVNWVKDHRYAIDGQVMTTAGVTASLPASLKLVEAIAGTEKAKEVADRLGVESYDAKNWSFNFHFDFQTYLLAAKNWIAFWRHETIGFKAAEGIDEISLAFAADAWSRTFRSQAVLVGDTPEIVSRRGLRFKVNNQKTDFKIELQDRHPLDVLEDSLEKIDDRYGGRTRKFVSYQLEYVMRAK